MYVVAIILSVVSPVVCAVIALQFLDQIKARWPRWICLSSMSLAVLSSPAFVLASFGFLSVETSCYCSLLAMCVLLPALFANGGNLSESLFSAAIAAVLIPNLVVVVAARRNEGATEVTPPGHRLVTIQSGGLERSVLVHVPPAYDGNTPLPLVLMLHGMGGTAANSMRETGWSEKADVETFIAAYPEATRPDPLQPPSLRRNPQAWNDGSGRFHAAERSIDDVAFISAVFDRLARDYRIDDRRVYVAGFSNGASMAFRVGAELSDRVAAIAPNAGACWTRTPQLKRGISLCYITGTADSLNPLEGGFPKLNLGGGNQGGKPKPPVSDSIEKWTKVLNCPDSPVSDETTNGVQTRRFGSGRDGAEVLFITVEGLGHHWAGGISQAPEFLVGRNTSKLKATDVVWDFFQSHPAHQ